MSAPSERPLHDYIDLESYDVVTGETHRALKAELERVKAERDEARASIKTIIKEDGVVASRQAARLNRALAALRKLRDATEWESEADGRAVRQIARAAIAEIEGEA
jgi:hypothetical protein